MSMMSEFKEFAMKGNVMDLAVGVIIGGAFGKIVDSVVGDLIMPMVGAIFGNLDFANKFAILGNVPAGTAMNLADLKKAGARVRILKTKELGQWKVATQYEEVQAAWAKQQEAKGNNAVGLVLEKVRSMMTQATK